MVTISHITLMAAALFDLCVMLLWDLQALQRNGYSSPQYNKWIKESGELSSTKRLIVLAVLVATCTTMANMSWIVMMILAATLFIQGIVALCSHRTKELTFDKHVGLRFFTSIALTLIAVAAVGYLGYRESNTSDTKSAAILAVMILAISPLLTMLVNWILSPFKKRPKN